MSAHTLARGHLEALLAEASAGGVDADTALRALLSAFAESYRQRKGADDLRAVLQFELDNAEGDVEYMFMRP